MALAARSFRSLGALLSLLLLAAAPPGTAPASEQFFVGATEDAGVINILLSGKHGVHGRNQGRIDPAGDLLLDQIVEEEGKPARKSNWRLVLSGGNRITGTISDARSPVTGDVAGNVIHLRFRSGEGPSVEQWITLQPDGRTATNRMIFRRIGITVATLESTIRRVD